MKYKNKKRQGKPNRAVENLMKVVSINNNTIVLAPAAVSALNLRSKQ